jgi:predicted transcriptional regulator
MPKPTAARAEQLLEQMRELVERGMSISQIGRETGKSSQAVHQYLRHHNLETVEMKRRNNQTLTR